MCRVSRFASSLLAVWLALLTLPALAASPRNVLLFISDGASWGTWQMASHYEFGALGRQPYDAFSVKLGMSTLPLNTATRPTGDGSPQVGYDAAGAWDRSPRDGSLGLRPHHFAGYEYLRREATDSAAAATALASGVATYNNAINHDNHGRALPYATLHFKALGKATGVVTSVPFSHATPAAFGAQNASRNDYAGIAQAMFANPALDLIFGAGHPLFDSNGLPRAVPDHRWVSAATWAAITAPESPRRFIQTRAEFDALADGRLQLPGGRVIGVAQVHDTLQANRTATVRGQDPLQASGTALNPGVPTLATLTRAALAVLGRNPKGLFLMVEGGAVDWMAHANDTARVIEEQIDFNHAVRDAVQWVQQHGGWDETLMIVLTDHGNGLPLGPDSDTVPFQPVQGHGKGRVPGVRWHSGSHTRELTLLWAHGAGAQDLYDEVSGVDPALAKVLGHNADGRYLANAGVGRTLLRLR